MAALFHDIDKTVWLKHWFSLPRYLLTSDEWTAMTAHPIKGANTLKALSLGNKEVLRLVEQHHELPGGRGYPKHMEPDMLSLILTACDVYAACTEARNYREEPFSSEAAIRKVARFAPLVIVEALRKAVRFERSGANS